MFDISILYFIIYVLFLLLYLIYIIVGQWKLYKKASRHGWEIFVPFYGPYVLNDMVGLSSYFYWIELIISFSMLFSIFVSRGIFLILFLVHIVYVIIYRINLSVNICKKFECGSGTVILCIIFNKIMLPAFGIFSCFEWNDNYVSCYGIFGDEDDDDVEESMSYCDSCGALVDSIDYYCQKCGNKINKM